MQIKCTQCGGDVPIEEDAGFIRCPYCETALYVDTDRTVLHYYMAAQAAAQDIGPTIQRKLSYMEINDPVAVQSSRILYFPFWRMDTTIGGSVTLPAAAPPMEDLESLKSPAGDLKLYTKKLGEEFPVVEPEVLLEDALVKAQKSLESEAVKFKSASLMHLPLYEVEYTCQKGQYRAIVEAVSGEVFADNWPAAPQKQKDRVLGWIAALAFVLFLLESALIPWFWVMVPAYVATGAGIYFLARRTLRNMGW